MPGLCRRLAHLCIVVGAETPRASTRTQRSKAMPEPPTRSIFSSKSSSLSSRPKSENVKMTSLSSRLIDVSHAQLSPEHVDLVHSVAEGLQVSWRDDAAKVSSLPSSLLHSKLVLAAFRLGSGARRSW